MTEHNWTFVQRAKGGPELRTCRDFGCGAISIRRWEGDNFVTTIHGNGDIVIEAPNRHGTRVAAGFSEEES